MDIISPLRYCEKRDDNGDGCDVFSSVVVEGLYCCQNHAQLLLKSIDDNGVIFITRLESIDNKPEV